MKTNPSFMSATEEVAPAVEETSSSVFSLLSPKSRKKRLIAFRNSVNSPTSPLPLPLPVFTASKPCLSTTTPKSKNPRSGRRRSSPESLATETSLSTCSSLSSTASMYPPLTTPSKPVQSKRSSAGSTKKKSSMTRFSPTTPASKSKPSIRFPDLSSSPSSMEDTNSSNINSSIWYTAELVQEIDCGSGTFDEKGNDGQDMPNNDKNHDVEMVEKNKIDRIAALTNFRDLSISNFVVMEGASSSSSSSLIGDDDQELNLKLRSSAKQFQPEEAAIDSQLSLMKSSSSHSQSPDDLLEDCQDRVSQLLARRRQERLRRKLQQGGGGRSLPL